VEEWATLLSWAIVGVIVGGRLGFVLFYEPRMFLEHPAEVIAVWHGGMSSHGGFIGVTLCLLWALRHKKSDILAVADVVVVPVAIGLALGRVGNFINQELYGPPTSLPWGILVPGQPGPVHPTQLYAVAKDLFIAAMCYWHLRFTCRTGNVRMADLRHEIPEGKTFALFLMLYGVLRFLVEYVRIQPYGWVYPLGIPLTRGQVLTVFLFAAGVVLWVWVGRRRGVNGQLKMEN
jgi:phosphatidylglycerol:prolipoprotein diacylglycerol transferase